MRLPIGGGHSSDCDSSHWQIHKSLGSGCGISEISKQYQVSQTRCKQMEFSTAPAWSNSEAHLLRIFRKIQRCKLCTAHDALNACFLPLHCHALALRFMMSVIFLLIPLGEARERKWSNTVVFLDPCTDTARMLVCPLPPYDPSQYGCLFQWTYTLLPPSVGLQTEGSQATTYLILDAGHVRINPHRWIA